MRATLNKSFTQACRSYSTSAPANAKVAVLGAAGGIGQPLSMLLKMSPHVDELALYDVANVPGVAADISHLPFGGKVTGNLKSGLSWPPSGDEGLKQTLTGAEVVVIPAGVPRKPGMTRDDLFNTNASIVATLADACAKHCPEAVLAIISNPVNSTVPIASKVLAHHGVYNPAKLCGVTTLDICRANTFIGEAKNVDPQTLDIPVIGGHAGKTILPLLSHTEFEFSDAERAALTHRIQFGGDEVVQAKAGAGSATLSMAYAGFLFAENVLRAAKGEDITMCAFVEQGGSPSFFSTPCKFGPQGVTAITDRKDMAMNDFEKAALEAMLPELTSQVEKGFDFGEKWVKGK